MIIIKKKKFIIKINSKIIISIIYKNINKLI